MKYKNSDINYFIAGQSLSLFGSLLVEYAIIWHVTLETKSGMLLGLSTVFAFLPKLLISPLAGVWADKFNRKKILIYSDLGVALGSLLIAIYLSLGYTQLYSIFIIMVIRSIGAGIQTPSVGAFAILIIPKEKLESINGLKGGIESVIYILAPAFSGFILSISGLKSVLYIDILTAIIACIILARINPTNNYNKDKTSWKQGIKSAIRYIKNNNKINQLFLYYFLYLFFTVPISLLSPLLVARIFGHEIWQLTLSQVFLSLGSVIGGVVVVYCLKPYNKYKLLLYCCGSIGFINLFLGWSIFTIFIALMTLLGCFLAIFNTYMVTIFQQNTSVQLQGRVFSLIQMISTGSIPLGMAFFGYISDSIDVRWIFSGIGLNLLLLAGIYFILYKKRIIFKL